YLHIKKAAEDAFMKNGGTLSHHHAVGTEHLPWVEEDVSPTGLKAVQAVKEGLDPRGIMNPGKIIPPTDPLKAWGLSDEALGRFTGSG
ncbi:MAG: FAD-linked oxidase C-terminal domain-containing protein, partial [Verrucomicrobiota bacterium]|nr:FAD-linked oxidase C-terminal domain-containing protein [Verrucomicrobiota bacterium]